MASLKRKRCLLTTAVEPLPSPPPLPDISSLDENLIYEILTRLSNPRSVFRCKSVCKQWNSLISAPYFRPNFLRHLAARPSASAADDEFPLLRPESQQETIGFLPIPADLRPQFCVLASYDDLILVGRTTPASDAVGRWFFVCNPLTKQWVTLPLAPFTGRIGEEAAIQFSERITVGFVCQPCYSYCDSKDQVLIDSQFKFRVVLVYEVDVYLCLEVFCSESDQWVDRFYDLGPAEPAVTSYFNHITLPSLSGKLYWWNDIDNASHIVCCDPFQIENPLIAFHCSDLCSIYAQYFGARPQVDLGVSQGRLHIIVVPADGLDVWRIEEISYDDQLWLKSIQSNLIGSRRGWMMIMNQRVEVKGILGMHPSDPDIVYLASGDVGAAGYDAVSSNLRSGELEVLGQDSQDSSMFGWTVFQLKIPFWPTPIPLPCNYETVTFDDGDDDAGGGHSIVAHSSMLVMSGEESESSLPVQLFDSSSSSDEARGGVASSDDDHHQDGGAMTAEEINTGSSTAGVKRIVMFYLMGAIFLKMVGWPGRG